MQHTSQPLTLESILNKAQDYMQQLHKVLVTESSLLKENNIGQLEKVTDEKNSLTKQIEQNEQLRIHFLSSRSLNPNEPSEWLKTKKLKTLWTEIKKTSQQAQRQNQINGLVINTNRRQVQTKLEILSAVPPSSELVYSASGENIKPRQSTTLVRA